MKNTLLEELVKIHDWCIEAKYIRLEISYYNSLDIYRDDTGACLAVSRETKLVLEPKLNAYTWHRTRSIGNKPHDYTKFSTNEFIAELNSVIRALKITDVLDNL